MGAENSLLAGCTHGSPCTPVPGAAWQLVPLTRPDGAAVSVFQPRQGEAKDGKLLTKAANTLRAIRHPNVLRYLGCGSGDKPWLAVESVLPLTAGVPGLTLPELMAGLTDILQGLSFLHTKLGMVHNNLTAASVFVAPDGRWCLGGFEHCVPVATATPTYLEETRMYRSDDVITPEEKSGKTQIDAGLSQSRDVYAVAKLVDALSGMLKDGDELSPELEQSLAACLSVDPKARPSASQLLDLPCLQNDFTEIITFLKNITLKNDKEKTQFFSSLPARLRSLPQACIARRLVQPLLSRFVLLEATAQSQVLPLLLQPVKDGSTSEGLLSEALFASHVTGHIYNMYHVHEASVRKLLLTHFPRHCHLFSRQQLEDDIFLQILLGLRDTDDDIVALSLRCLADLVPVLGGDVVIGGKRKAFFFQGLPKAADKADLSAPQNLHSALPSYHNSLSKPTLKDLAMGSSERERKNKERELRREEAKRKREERRKRLKEKELEADETSPIQQINGDEPTANGDEPNTTFNDDWGNNDDKPEQFALDDAWSDLDEKINAEIEAELSGSIKPAGKVLTSPNPYSAPSPPPPVSVDWSDVSAPLHNGSNHSLTRGVGFLKLGGGSKSKSNGSGDGAEQNVTSTEWGDDGDWGHDNLNNSNFSNINDDDTTDASKPNKSLKLTSSKTKKDPKKSAVKKVDDDNLGFGYDIKSVDIKPKSEIDDLFADMAPSFSAPSLNAPVLPDLTASEGSGNPAKAKAAMFDVTEPDNQESGGWGEDEDLAWGDDF